MESIVNTVTKCSLLEKATFYKISNYGCISKPQLLKELGSKHATLSRAVDTLLTKKLVIESAKAESSTAGRKPKLLSVNPESFYLFGVNISRINVGVILTDASLRKLDFCRFELKGNTSPDFIIENIKNIITSLLEKHSIDAKKVLGIGIGTPGKLDKSNGIIVYADNFGEQWSNVPIRKSLQSEFNIPVILENGADAATFAEFTMGSARNHKHVFFVNIGVGIRCGVINDGKIIPNINNIDSTYGHIVLEPSGKKCTCGNYGCMVMYATIKPIIEEYVKMLKLQNSSLPHGDFENINIFDVINASNEGDSAANSILTNAAIYMGIGLANITSILNPDIVVLGGPIIEKSDIYFNKTIEIARSRIFKMDHRNISFVKAHFQKEAVALGVCAIMLDQYFNKK